MRFVKMRFTWRLNNIYFYVADFMLGFTTLCMRHNLSCVADSSSWRDAFYGDHLFNVYIIELLFIIWYPFIHIQFQVKCEFIKEFDIVFYIADQSLQEGWDYHQQGVRNYLVFASSVVLVFGLVFGLIVKANCFHYSIYKRYIVARFFSLKLERFPRVYDVSNCLNCSISAYLIFDPKTNMVSERV